MSFKKASPNERSYSFQRVFVTGIIFLLPTLITIFLIVFFVGVLDKYFADPLGSSILQVLIWITDLQLLRDYAAILKPLIGFPVAIIIVILVGYLMATFLGRRILHWFEKYLLAKFPIVSFIYPHAKKLIDTFLNKDHKAEFKAVVSVEYPRKGIWSIGFITSEGLSYVKKASGKDLVTVFIPSSPTPFTGYTIMVCRDELISVNMSVDDAIRFVVSGGILTPKELPEKPIPEEIITKK